MQAIGKYRWTVCALIFWATTINYLDRQVISLVVEDYLTPEFNWSETDYANITVAFQLAYAIGLFGVGSIIDRLGTKIGYALSLFLWSLAAMGHALIGSTRGFIMARAALGVTEAGNFPSAIKTVAEWFPKRERAFATGIFNAGTNIGAIIAPLTVPFIAKEWGWRMAFVATGAIGLVWLIFWFWLYEIPKKQKRLSKEEYDYIHSDTDELVAVAEEQQLSQKVSWWKLVAYRQTWALILGKFLTDGVWWFYLFWLPKFLNAQFGLTKGDIALPVAAVYMISSIGSVFGGWLPMRLINNGAAVFRARKRSMLIYAFFALPVVGAQLLGQHEMWLAVLIIGLAAAAHQAWSANIFTTASDMFPKKAVGSVTGLGGMAGALGGMVTAKVAGYLFDYYKNIGELETGYMVMFVICGFAYLTAWVLMFSLVPKGERVNI